MDVILTNNPQLFANPFTVPPVKTDDPNNGKPSDHLTVIAVSLNKSFTAVSRDYHNVTVRPLPDSKIKCFGDWLENKDWSWLDGIPDPSQQVEEWKKIVKHKLDEFCPIKVVKLSNRDKSFFTEDLKHELRQLCRIYRKHGRSTLFVEMKCKFNKNYKKAAAKYLEKNVEAVINDDPGKAANQGLKTSCCSSR